MPDHGSPDPLKDTVYKRGELLCAIDEQPRAKPALTEAIDASRSTVDRGVTELLEADCIERHGSKYSPTLLGTLSCTRYRRYRSNVSALDNTQEIVSSLPPATALSTTFLKGADVHPADPAGPEAALQPAVDLLADAKRLLGLAPVKISLYVDLICEHATANNLSAEIIVEEGTLQPLLRKDEKRLRELAADGQIEILVSDEVLRYALWWMKSSQQTVAGATVYGDGGIKGLMLNSAPEAVEWAQNEYERRREAAENRPIDELLDG
ncbi:helix-turn-helix transcriptional regulator [Halococcus salifodinae]|uniref:Uncharacterized protein n=1 Tax=Halococcus salifodinae DSM 8989 TaxID=1227456 RepID=M0N3G5_9EURY|nr:hypothetical protein C450_12235 [Halococcus salifodinae DSM 8989]